MMPPILVLILPLSPSDSNSICSLFFISFNWKHLAKNGSRLVITGLLDVKQVFHIYEDRFRQPSVKVFDYFNLSGKFLCRTISENIEYQTLRRFPEQGKEARSYPDLNFLHHCEEYRGSPAALHHYYRTFLGFSGFIILELPSGHENFIQSAATSSGILAGKPGG